MTAHLPNTHSPNGPESVDTSTTLTFTPAAGQPHLAAADARLTDRSTGLTDRSAVRTAVASGAAKVREGKGSAAQVAAGARDTPAWAYLAGLAAVLWAGASLARRRAHRRSRLEAPDDLDT